MELAELDFFTDERVHADLPGYLQELRAKTSVFRLPHHGVFMVTGYDEVLEVLSKPSDIFSSCTTVTGPIPPLPFTPDPQRLREQVDQHRAQLPFGAHLVTFDGKFHSVHREFLTRLLTHRRLKNNADYMSGLIDKLIAKVIHRGECEVTQDIAQALSVLVIADLLGVPVEERAELVSTLVAPPSQLGGDVNQSVAPDPHTFLHDRFRRYLVERRENPGDDLMSGLVQARYRDGSEPDLLMLVRLACFMFAAGQDTSARLVGFSFRILAERPDIQDRLRAEPELVPEFIEEALRLDCPVKVATRLAMQPMTIGGQDIPAGTLVTVNIGAANRDPGRFDDPDRFDLGRPNKRDHLSFSRGPHGCIGAPLARLEARMMLEKFLPLSASIRISERHHGPPEDRRYEFEPTFLLNGLKALHIEWDKAG